MAITAPEEIFKAYDIRGLYGDDSSSPPPSRAAVVIARASFVNSLPRRESTTAFLCLIEAHLE